jgi:hypothetical protein
VTITRADRAGVPAWSSGPPATMHINPGQQPWRTESNAVSADRPPDVPIPSGPARARPHPRSDTKTGTKSAT